MSASAAVLSELRGVGIFAAIAFSVPREPATREVSSRLSSEGGKGRAAATPFSNPRPPRRSEWRG
eukprot:13186297-Alexandrium_andersonii.AAC.1